MGCCLDLRPVELAGLVVGCLLNKNVLITYCSLLFSFRLLSLPSIAPVAVIPFLTSPPLAVYCIGSFPVSMSILPSFCFQSPLPYGLPFSICNFCWCAPLLRGPNRATNSIPQYFVLVCMYSSFFYRLLSSRARVHLIQPALLACT